MEDVLLIPMMAIGVPLVIVPTVIVTKHLQHRREWAHRERMRALELGHPLPQDQPWPALAGGAIGAIVPAAAFFFASLANSVPGSPNNGAFFSAMVVSLAALYAASSIVRRAYAPHAPSPSPAVAANGKPPAFDPDAFAGVGRRG